MISVPSTKDLRVDTHKSFFQWSDHQGFTLRTLMDQWSMPLCFQSYNSLKRISTIFLFLPNFWAKTAGFQRKKCFFAQWSWGFILPTPLVVRPLQKNTFFMRVFPGKPQKILFLIAVHADPGNLVVPATASACFTNPGCELSAECDSFKVV